jgi:hypothetical protein
MKMICSISYRRNLRTAILILAFSLITVSTLQQVQAADRSRTVYHAQMRLLHKGYNPGPTDGVMGRKTQRAIAKFQWDKGLSVTASLDRPTRRALGLTVYGYAQVGAAKLQLLDVPPQQFTPFELLTRIQELRKVRFDGSKHFMLYEIEGFSIHTGHITRLIHDECISPFEVSIGEMYVKGQSLKSADYGDIFADVLAAELGKLHNTRATTAIKKSDKEIVLVCTAAMF